MFNCRIKNKKAAPERGRRFFVFDIVFIFLCFFLP